MKSEKISSPLPPSPLIRYGLLAGHGALLENLLSVCQEKKLPFFVLAFEGQTDSRLIQGCPHQWVALGQIGQSIDILKQQGVTHLVMAGRFKRPALTALKMDAVGLRWLRDLSKQFFRDDALLSSLIKKLEQEGFRVISPDTLLGGEVLASKGNLSPQQMNQVFLKDISLGVRLLKALSPFDCSQAVVIQEESVLAIEDTKGTNDLIRRAASQAQKGGSIRGPVLIKGCKQGQNTRVDRPVVGPDTLGILEENGFAGLAIEAGGVMLVDANRFSNDIKEKNLFCYGYDANDG